MTTVVSECTDGYDSLSTYYTSVANYLAGGTTIPDPTSTVNGLSFDNLQTFTSQSVDISPGHSIGAAVEVISEFYSLTRELDMATQGKVSLSAAAASEAQEDADFHSQNSGFFTGVISGQPTSGTRS